MGDGTGGGGGGGGGANIHIARQSVILIPNTCILIIVYAIRVLALSVDLVSA